MSLALSLSGCTSGTDTSTQPDDVISTTADDESIPEPSPDDISALSDDDADSNDDGGAQGTATVAIDGRTFEFDLHVCGIYGDGEAVVSGPGGEVGSDVPSYLDGDSVGWSDGEFRIDIGADGPFQSTDDILSIGSSLGGSFTLEESGAGFLARGHAWDGSGADLGTGTLEFTCP